MTDQYIYRGDEGHPFYVKGRPYAITIEQTFLLRRIVVYLAKGHGGNIVDGSYIKYKNFETFKRNWARPECSYPCPNQSDGSYNNKPLCRPHMYAAAQNGVKP